MRIEIEDNTVLLWLSEADITHWTERPGATWPCSALRGAWLFAAFNRKGLSDLEISGKDKDFDCPADEFNAITSDFLATSLPKEHPAYYVAVGQFKDR